MARQYTLQRKASEGPKIDFQNELNEQQLAVVTAPPGPALVIAGAGSGKTRTLVYRVAYLIENGIPPQHILLLTFTNKAAREMLDRAAALISSDLRALWGGTFHSIGNRILRRHPVEAGFSAGFGIMDREDSEALMDEIIPSLGFDPKQKQFPKSGVIADVLSYQLNTGRALDEVLVEKYPHFLEHTAYFSQARKKYEARKRKTNALDFDDLLEKTVSLFRAHPAIAAHYQRQFQFILVDEYQDTNHLQNDFIEILASRHHNVMAVGDDAQSIYSWRGADFRNILEFPQRHADTTVYKIEINYRSVPEILAVANAAIAANTQQFQKELSASRKAAGQLPALVPLPDSQQQAQFVAQRILELNETGTPLEEIAVLYRAHFHSMELQMELARRGIPFELTSGLRFFEQAHIKDLAAFLKWVVNPRDEIAFKRMVKLLPGIGPRSADSLWEKALIALQKSGIVLAQESLEEMPIATPAPPSNDPDWSVDNDDPPTAALPESVANPWQNLPSIKALLLPLKVPAKSQKAWEQLVHTLDELAPAGQLERPAQMIESVMEAVYDGYLIATYPNYDQRREDIHTLANFSRQYESSQQFLDQLALLTSLDHVAAGKNDPNHVTLTSVHQAKGLEWKIVFAIWLAEGKFPSFRSLENKESIEEERRLFYVTVTRAKEELYLCYPHLSFAGGYGDPMQQPSRFLCEIPEASIEKWDVTNRRN